MQYNTIYVYIVKFQVGGKHPARGGGGGGDIAPPLNETLLSLPTHTGQIKCKIY